MIYYLRAPTLTEELSKIPGTLVWQLIINCNFPVGMGHLTLASSES